MYRNIHLVNMDTTSRRGMVRLTQHQHSHSRLRRLVRAHVSFRRRLLRSIAAVLVLAACAAAVIVAQDLLAAAGGGGDEEHFVPFPDGLAPMPNLHRRNSNSSSNNSVPSLSDCRTWIPIHSSSNLASFDLVRSCAVESALARSGATPVCILLNKNSHLDLSKPVSWISRLRLHHPPGSLLTFAPSLEAVFQGTPLEEPFVSTTAAPPQSSKATKSPTVKSHISSAFEPLLLWALLWRYGGLVLNTNTVLVQSLESYYSFLWFDPVLSEVSPYFFRLQEPNHRLARMVLEHFSEQAETAAAMEMEESMLMMGEEEEDGQDDEDRRSGFKFKLTDTDWSRIVESFCGMSITEATRPRLCHDVEIIAPTSVKALAAGDRSSPPPPGGLRDADYVAINVLDPAGASGLGVRNKLWMKEACPVTHSAMFV